MLNQNGEAAQRKNCDKKDLEKKSTRINTMKIWEQ